MRCFHDFLRPCCLLSLCLERLLLVRCVLCMLLCETVVTVAVANGMTPTVPRPPAVSLRDYTPKGFAAGAAFVSCLGPDRTSVTEGLRNSQQQHALHARMGREAGVGCVFFFFFYAQEWIVCMKSSLPVECKVPHCSMCSRCFKAHWIRRNVGLCSTSW